MGWSLTGKVVFLQSHEGWMRVNHADNSGGEFQAERTASALGLVCSCQSQGIAKRSAWLELSNELGMGGDGIAAGRCGEPLRGLSLTLIEMGSHCRVLSRGVT